MITYRAVLSQSSLKLKTSGFKSFYNDASLLICDFTKEFLLSNLEESFPQEKLELFYRLLHRRQMGEPIAKIIGRRMFWKHSFEISIDVLDPRPESEFLVSEAIFKSKRTSKKILDLGTGSGCIAISLALELDNCSITASDVSLKALEIAKLNSLKLGAKVNFIHSDWFDEINDVYDIIVCNPPYIDIKEKFNLEVEVRDFEPDVALFSDIDSVNCYRLIAKKLSSYLRNGGCAIFEVGKFQSRKVAKIFKDAGFKNIDFSNDFSGIERILCVKKDA